MKPQKKTIKEIEKRKIRQEIMERYKNAKKYNLVEFLEWLYDQKTKGNN